MLLEVVLILENPVAVPAVMVIWASNVVPLKCMVASEIEVARVADPMEAGIVHMLLESIIVGERSFTAVAIRHGGRRQKEKGVVFDPVLVKFI